MTDILVLANEHVNRRMAGPSIRSFEFSRVLSADGHRVTLASPFPSDLPPQPFAVTTYDASSLPALLADHRVVILQGWVMERFPLLREADVRLVIDLYDPFPLEVLILFAKEPLEKRLGPSGTPSGPSPTRSVTATSSSAPARSNATTGWDG